ncbi:MULTISPECIES: deoxynucleoside kinase [Bacillus cereus group]|nr:MULTISPECIES: deoxynucleoside kinase [Bacillus cereus group]MDA1674598.1 deoxynucleoside kinase [Bacillus cereus group sp. TH152-1LC]
MNKNISVIIDGTVGAGKSTLMNILKDLGFEAFPEPVVDNPLLDKFYHDKEKYSFPLQIEFLNKRFAHLKASKAFERVTLDRSIYNDIVFAQMLRDSGDLPKEFYNIYEELLENMLEHCEPPTLMIYLQISVDEAIRRIQKRGRDFEQIVERTYWEDLNSRYGAFFKEYNRSPLLVVDVSGLDFENNLEDRKFVIEKINEKFKELGYDLTLDNQ